MRRSGKREAAEKLVALRASAVPAASGFGEQLIRSQTRRVKGVKNKTIITDHSERRLVGHVAAIAAKGRVYHHRP
jgi:hypothetical protein